MRPQLQPTTIDQIVREETVQDLAIEEALQLYQQEKENIIKIEDWQAQKAYAFNLKVPTLSPTQLALFCTHEEAHEAFPYYLNSLLQKSYKERNNNFILAFNKSHHDLLSQVQGTKEQPLNITINGNTGNHCAYGSEHAKITINGNTGENCALGSNYNTITINGNTKDNCAAWSKHLNITINGNTEYYCAYKSEHINLTINGNTKDWCAWESKHLNLTINGKTENNCAYGSKHAKITINGNTENNFAWSSSHINLTINGKVGEYPSTNATYYTNNKETYEKLTTYGCKVTLR